MRVGAYGSVTVALLAAGWSCGGAVAESGGKAASGGGGSVAGAGDGGAGGAWAATGGAAGASNDLAARGGSSSVAGGTARSDGVGCGPNVTPCGGDVVGTWNVTSSCITVGGEMDMRALGVGCSSAPVTGTLEVTGTWTANADGTYSDSTTTTGNVQIDLPCTCLEADGTCVSCSRIGGPVAFLAGYASITCEEDPNADTAGCDCSSGCICSATIDQAGRMGVPTPQRSFEAPAFPSTGTYTTEDSALTLRTDSTFTLRAGEQEYSYCASETALTMTPVRRDWTGTLTGAVELRRQ